MPERTYVIGVGMTRFEKPGTRDWDYPDMVREAGTRALADAGVPYERIEHVFAGYCYGDSASGQRAVYELGRTGIPVVNVNNNCSTGSSALYLARQAVRGGLADCVLAVGFEKMERGSLSIKYADRANPLGPHLDRMAELHPPAKAPFAVQIFGDAGREHMARYGSAPDHMAWIAWKNHRHSAANPYAQFQHEYSFADIKTATMIHDPLTKLQCSPTSDGAAVAVLASAGFVARHGLAGRAVELAGQALVTDTGASFDRGCIEVAGSELTRRAARRVLDQAEARVEAVDVIELHDCFSTNELITYEALGLAPDGEGHRLIDREATTYGGRWVVNPSGGLISKGHPLGATGLAQCCELTWQLRGEAGARQVEGARVALQHNIGLGGAAVVSVYRMAA